MTRFSDATMEAAGALPHVPYVLFAEFDFSSGFVRVNSADRVLQNEGNDYQPLGTLGAISSVRENGNLIPEKMEYTLSGVDNSLITTTLTEDYHYRAAKLWVAYVDPSTCALLHTPRLLREDRMDVMTINTEPNVSSISLVCENSLIRWNESAGWTYTDEHQKVFDATDDFFDQVALLPNKVAKWRGALVSSGGFGGGGAGGGGKRGRPDKV